MKLEEIEAFLKDKKVTLEERFVKACVLVDKLRKQLNITQTQELQFYGYYKQGAFGTCNSTMPPRIQAAKREKWKAWNDLGALTKAAAQQAYIDHGLKVLNALRSSPPALKICEGLTEETLHKLGIEKILRSEGKKLCLVDDAKNLNKEEDLKIWSAIGESMKAKENNAVISNTNAAAYPATAGGNTSGSHYSSLGNNSTIAGSTYTNAVTANLTSGTTNSVSTSTYASATPVVVTFSTTGTAVATAMPMNNLPKASNDSIDSNSSNNTRRSAV